MEIDKPNPRNLGFTHGTESDLHLVLCFHQAETFFIAPIDSSFQSFANGGETKNQLDTRASRQYFCNHISRDASWAAGRPWIPFEVFPR